MEILKLLLADSVDPFGLIVRSIVGELLFQLFRTCFLSRELRMTGSRHLGTSRKEAHLANITSKKLHSSVFNLKVRQSANCKSPPWIGEGSAVGKASAGK